MARSKYYPPYAIFKSSTNSRWIIVEWHNTTLYYFDTFKEAVATFIKNCECKGRGCYKCCETCNLDLHRCSGCGEYIQHSQKGVCNDCKEVLARSD